MENKKKPIPKPTQQLYNEITKLNWSVLKSFDEQKKLQEPFEIIAVDLGLKPAYLGGVPESTQQIHDSLNIVLPLHGFKIKKTPAPIIYGNIKPNRNDDIGSFMIEFQKSKSAKINAFWAYKDEALGELIDSAIAGETSLHLVTGYPECCLDHYHRQNVEIDEKYLSDVTSLSEARYRLENYQNPFWDILVQERKAALADSILKFPFIHFTACPRCLESTSSPAGEVNESYRKALKTLDLERFKQIIEYSKAFYKYMHGLG